MTITYHKELEQGSDAWFAARCGLLCASEMKNIITPKELKPVSSKVDGVLVACECEHLYELLAQRITGYVEPTYIGDDMLRGKVDEIEARQLYNDRYAPVTEMGFITNDKWGFKIGWSPDGLVGDDGCIEAKSRRQKYQVRTITKFDMPEEFLIQVQTGLLVSERSWCDFLTYCGGMPMMRKRIYADPVIQAAILNVASMFEGRLQMKMREYESRLLTEADSLIPTERKLYNEGEISV
jgi:hypothetical protein